MSGNIVLGYWAVRGKCQVLRHLLSYTGLPFQEKIYKTQQQYNTDLANMGPFPNLPYIKDANFICTDVLGIARYIVRKSGKLQLLGKTPSDQAIMDNFIYAFIQIMTPLINMFFNKKVNDIKVGHFYKIKSQIQRFDKAIKGNSTILNYITIADFFLSEFSYYIEKLYPGEFVKYTNVIAVRDNIMALPQIKTYYTRQNAINTPFLQLNKTSIPFYWPGTQPVILNLSSKTPSKKPTDKQPAKPTNTNIKQQEPSQTPQQAPTQQQQQQNWDEYIQPYAPQHPYKIAVISGSISGNSSINFLLGAITGLGHPAFQFDWCDISSLELHNEDIDEQGTDMVNYLRGQVYEAAAVLIGISTTNHLVTTALTNAYNWLVPVLKQKPVALVSMQSSQQQFRKALDGENIPYLKSAKLAVSDPFGFFNGEGGIDGSNMNRVIYYFNKLVEFIETGN